MEAAAAPSVVINNNITVNNRLEKSRRAEKIRQEQLKANPELLNAYRKRRAEATARHRNRQRKDPIKKAELNAYKRKQDKGNIRSKLTYYKNGAKERILEWLLTDEEAVDLFYLACHYCKRVGPDYGLVGIDRKDNNLGYTLANSLPCCSMCNRAKGTLPYESMQAYIKSIISL